MSVEVAPVIAEVTVTVDTAALTVTPLLASLTVAPSPAPVVDVTVQQIAVEVASAGATGPRGESGNVTQVIAAGPMPALTVVAVNPAGLGYPASSNIPGDADLILGVSATSALAGEQVTVYSRGEIPTGSPMPVGALYLHTDGSLTTSINSGSYQLAVAYALTSQLLTVRLGLPMYH